MKNFFEKVNIWIYVSLCIPNYHVDLTHDIKRKMQTVYIKNLFHCIQYEYNKQNKLYHIVFPQ